ncbi:MAG: hypothetical protein J6Z22_10970 [Lachnospiraceae bacterium]|nr:hypothetical protein [Lachnospiraceae bacterium]
MKKGNLTGFQYFMVHACVETACFYLLRYHYPLGIAVAIAFIYDFFAFLPQGLLGQWIQRHPRIPFETIGNALMVLSIFPIASSNTLLHFCGYVVLATGNAILHECGAIATVAESEGKIFPSALFVSGGSVGIVIGQAMGVAQVSPYFLIIPILLSEVFALMARTSLRKGEYPRFDCEQEGLSPIVILLVAFLVTTVRSYLGYAIPISWNKEWWQTFFLFFTMGFGKAFGGYVADRFGVRSAALVGTLLAIPFLIFGENIMVLSIIGVCFFSMTMSISFAMCLSVMPTNPGMAFGITTAALFLGLVPVFFVKLSPLANAILIVICSILCCALLMTTLKKQGKGKVKNISEDAG